MENSIINTYQIGGMSCGGCACRFKIRKKVKIPVSLDLSESIIINILIQ